MRMDVYISRRRLRDTCLIPQEVAIAQNYIDVIPCRLRPKFVTSLLSASLFYLYIPIGLRMLKAESYSAVDSLTPGNKPAPVAQ